MIGIVRVEPATEGGRPVLGVERVQEDLFVLGVWKQQIREVVKRKVGGGISKIEEGPLSKQIFLGIH